MLTTFDHIFNTIANDMFGSPGRQIEDMRRELKQSLINSTHLEHSICVSDTDVNLYVSVPGYTKTDLQIDHSLHHDLSLISLKADTRSAFGGVERYNCKGSTINAKFSLGKRIDPLTITAKLENGILCIGAKIHTDAVTRSRIAIE